MTREALKKYLDDNDIAYARVARRLGITPPYFSDILNCKRYPGESLAEQIDTYTKGAIPWKTLVDPKKYDAEQFTMFNQEAKDG